jgi:hypothetical protein
MAQKAKIVLVEAASSSFTDLFTAVDVATAQVTTGGGEGEVSMSWSGGEFSTESSNDSHFQNTSVVYFASLGRYGRSERLSFRLALCGVRGWNYDSQEQLGRFHAKPAGAAVAAAPASTKPSCRTRTLPALIPPNVPRRTSRSMPTRTRESQSMTALLSGFERMAGLWRHQRVVTIIGRNREFGWPLCPQHRFRVSHYLQQLHQYP